jgi:hypothetical protein
MNPFLSSTNSKRGEVKRKKPEEILTKDRLIEIIRALLQTNLDLGFLLKMDQTELETLVSCIRVRVDGIGK